MMLTNPDEVIETARKYVVSKGILATAIKSIKKIAGSVRGEYLPHKNQDFWIVVFFRTKRKRVPVSVLLIV